MDPFYSVSLHETFFTRLMTHSNQLELLLDNKCFWIAVGPTRHSPLSGERKELVEKINFLFQEILKKGKVRFAESVLAELNTPFVDLTFASNMHSLFLLYHGGRSETSPIERAPSLMVVKENSKKRLCAQVAPLGEKTRRLQGRVIPFTLMEEWVEAIRLLAFRKTFLEPIREIKVRPLARQDYVEIMPPDFTFIIEEGEQVKRFPIHRSLLFHYPYFLKPFLPLIEPSQFEELVVYGVKRDLFELLVDFLYSQRLDLPKPDFTQSLVKIEAAFSADIKMYSDLKVLAERCKIQLLTDLCNVRLKLLFQLMSDWMGKRTEVKEDFIKLMEPYLNLAREVPNKCVGDIARLLYPPFPCHPNETIKLNDIQTGKQVTIQGNRVILARSLYFRRLLNGVQEGPLPPKSVLQYFATLIQERTSSPWLDQISPIHTDFISFFKENPLFCFMIIVVKNRDEADAELAQLALYLNEVELDFGNIEGLLSCLKAHQIEGLQPLQLILKHFGSRFYHCTLSFKNPSYEIVSVLDIIVDMCPRIQNLQIEGSDRVKSEEDLPLFDVGSILITFKEIQSIHLSGFKVVAFTSPTGSSKSFKTITLSNCSLTEDAKHTLNRFNFQIFRE